MVSTFSLPAFLPLQGAFASSKNNADAAALEDFASLLSEQRDAFDRELRWATRGEEAVSSSSSDLGEGEDEEDVAAKDFADEKRGSDFQLEVSLHHGALPRETRLFTLLEKQRAQLLERQRRRFERLGLTDALPSKPFCAQLCTWPPEEAALAAECKVVGELKKILGEKGDSVGCSSGCGRGVCNSLAAKASLNRAPSERVFVFSCTWQARDVLDREQRKSQRRWASRRCAFCRRFRWETDVCTW